MVDLSAVDNHYTTNKLPWNTNYDEIRQIKVLQLRSMCTVVFF